MAPDAERWRLGLGLIGIGRQWGYRAGEVPPESEARALLDYAFANGIRYFDTAPSYGCSEQRTGGFLRGLSAAERAELTVATKFGEHWDDDRGEPFVDHSYDALARSLERSIERLGRIDVLQLHKTSPAVLASGDLARAWELARGLGIAVLGPSVADAESARIACRAGVYQMMQLPVNRASAHMWSALNDAAAAGLWVAANRPFEMGRAMYEHAEENAELARAAAFRFVLSQPSGGVVLSGTRSPAHLAENISAFLQASN